MKAELQFAPKKEEIAISWSYDDVLQEVPHLTKDQAMIVLGVIEKRHDANIGINWDVIKYTAEALFPSE